MSEIIFEVRQTEESGLWARAIGYPIFTQGEEWAELRVMVKDAVACHFEGDPDAPKLIRLHFVRDEALAA